MTDIKSSVDQLVEDQVLFHSIVHGDENTEVETEAGTQPSIKKAIHGAFGDVESIKTAISIERAGYLVPPSGGAGTLKFDFQALTLEVTVGLNLLKRDGYTSIPPQTVSLVDSYTRFIYWNDDTKTFVVTTGATKPAAADPYLIAVVDISSKRVVHAAIASYEIGGIKVLGADDAALFRVGYISPSTSTACVNFNFDAMQVEFSAGFNILKQGTYTSIPEQVIAITSSTRFIHWDEGTKSFVASVGNAKSVINDPYLVASIRPLQNRVLFTAFDGYKINGSIIGNITGNRNLIDYVRGQEAIGEKYSIPVCDLYRESGINYLNKDSFVLGDQLHPNDAANTFISQQTTEFLRRFGGFTDLTGKTIGVFGGSFSVNTPSQQCKDVWVSELGVTYTDYGVGGAGFAKTGNLISSQVAGAAVHDIYVLWCSTNDATSGVPVGGIDDTGTTTQSGGMNTTIALLYAKNPTAKIVILNSLKAYSANYLYDPTVLR